MCPRMRLQHYGIGALVLIVLLVAYGCSQDPQAQKAAYMQKATTYMANEKYAEAILAWRNALLIDPQDVQLLYQLGLAHLKKGTKEDLREAFRVFNRVVQLDDNHLDAHTKVVAFY